VGTGVRIPLGTPGFDKKDRFLSDLFLCLFTKHKLDVVLGFSDPVSFFFFSSSTVFLLVLSLDNGDTVLSVRLITYW
jgi:hypothetical protein